MTAKEFLDLHFTQPDDLVNGDFREIFERKIDEFAKIKILESKIERIFNLLGLKHIEVVKQVILSIQLKGEFSTEDLKQLSDMLPKATSILAKTLNVNIATLRIKLKLKNMKSDILFDFFDELEIAYGLINR